MLDSTHTICRLIKTQYLEAELMEHITFAAKAIKDCANGCDAYLKKTKFAQVLTATSWNTAFEGYITTFVTLRERMMFTLTINACTRSPDVDCRIKLSVDDRIIQQEIVNAKERFASAESLEHQVLKKFVESNGGADAIKTDDAKLERLLNYPQAATARTVKKYGIEYAVHSSSRDAQILQLELVKKELNDSKDLEELIKNNSNVFSRKLDLQQEELKEHIGSQGDRIIAAVTGPHDGILDPVSDLYGSISQAHTERDAGHTRDLAGDGKRVMNRPSIDWSYDSRSSTEMVGTRQGSSFCPCLTRKVPPGE